MASIKPNSSLRDYQLFVDKVYGPNNQRHFTVDEMLTNINRFVMRGLKGIRKGDNEKVKHNLIIAMSWTASLMNQFNIDLEEYAWHRFPYVCSYCGSRPCVCRAKKVKVRKKIRINAKLRPTTIRGFQEMLGKIYPPDTRSLEHAGIHLAEEVGELSEAVMTFRGHHTAQAFKHVTMEAADVFSCFMGVFNSLGFDYEKHLVQTFKNGCHACKKTPCACEYNYVVGYKS
jgi:NTP pyrophosphatase (non-canonical NTP hydrolase)